MEERRSDLVVNGRIMRDLLDTAIAQARCITTGDRPDDLRPVTPETRSKNTGLYL
ncbi:hypothetical protein GCM10010177_61940 [Actinomadura citrea]|nr:hypothetical protein GCM10010177_61940 [Actinomadura citrea]